MSTYLQFVLITLLIGMFCLSLMAFQTALAKPELTLEQVKIQISQLQKKKERKCKRLCKKRKGKRKSKRCKRCISRFERKIKHLEKQKASLEAAVQPPEVVKKEPAVFSCQEFVKTHEKLITDIQANYNSIETEFRKLKKIRIDKDTLAGKLLRNSKCRVKGQQEVFGLYVRILVDQNPKDMSPYNISFSAFFPLYDTYKRRISSLANCQNIPPGTKTKELLRDLQFRKLTTDKIVKRLPELDSLLLEAKCEELVTRYNDDKVPCFKANANIWLNDAKKALSAYKFEQDVKSFERSVSITDRPDVDWDVITKKGFKQCMEGTYRLKYYDTQGKRIL